MSMIKFKDIKEWNDKDKKAKTRELYKEMMKLRSQTAVGTSENPGRIKQIKKTIARILTLENQNRSKKGLEEKQRNE